ncbi:lipopolysaccharide-induced tumor necrosis factor-alpha factor homolog [Saccoglossus kowalevskii]|uniref:Lipopolysaccharide-induced tumor necrosis factor-alpha factor homolog n=1 Tax=Saccoglossus kowalevskii TaxID=10224 RepID=A0ABM0H1K4_SACKO|nr:PREDICTED: lipopolysaccharide-induced tumor necrosis factor-alpha factor homolog [Saccoglossus kowalevskii]
MMDEKQSIATPNVNYSDPPPQYQGESHPGTNAPLYQAQQPYPGQPRFGPSLPVCVIQGSQQYLDFPACVRCVRCNTDIVTDIQYKPGVLTWMSCGIICLVGGWIGCFLIPFCINACKDVVHTCPNCKCVIGKYDKLR